MGSPFNERTDADLHFLFWPIRLKNDQRLSVIGSVKGEYAVTACYPIKQPSDRWSLGHVTALKSLHLSFWIFRFVTPHLVHILSPSSFLLFFSVCVWFTSVIPEHDRNFSLQEPQKQILWKQGARAQTVVAMKDLCNNKSWCTFNSLCNRDRWETKRTTGRRAEEGDKGWFIPAA